MNTEKRLEARCAFMTALDIYIEAKHTVIHDDRGYVRLSEATNRVEAALDALLDAQSEDTDNRIHNATQGGRGR